MERFAPPRGVLFSVPYENDMKHPKEVAPPGVRGMGKGLAALEERIECDKEIAARLGVLMVEVKRPPSDWGTPPHSLEGRQEEASVQQEKKRCRDSSSGVLQLLRRVVTSLGSLLSFLRLHREGSWVNLPGSVASYIALCETEDDGVHEVSVPPFLELWQRGMVCVCRLPRISVIRSRFDLLYWCEAIEMYRVRG